MNPWIKLMVRALAVGMLLSVMGFRLSSDDPKIPAQPEKTMVLIFLLNVACGNFPPIKQN
jgi:hypothetical protein